MLGSGKIKEIKVKVLTHQGKIMKACIDVTA